jgi:hypothetical protein
MIGALITRLTCTGLLLSLGLIPMVPLPVSAGSQMGTRVHGSSCGATMAPMRAFATPGAVTSVRIYLVNINGKGLGCGGGLVSVMRHIAPTGSPLTAALRLLLAERHACGGRGLCTAFSRSQLRIGRVAVARGTATIRLNGTLRLGGVCDSPRVRGQLRATALQFPTVHAVAIFVNNVPLDRVLSER